MKSIPHSVKPSKTVEEQLDIFKSRGLIIGNEEWAKSILTHVSYYRLTAYTLSLKNGDQFNKNVTFENIYRLYEFDLKLRSLVMEVTEAIEISMRTHISLTLSQKYDGMGYIYAENFMDSDKHDNFIKELNRTLELSKDVFVKHYYSKYAGEFPVWVAMEITTFGMISKLFKNLKKEDKDYIGYMYYDGIKGFYVSSWLHSISNLRNICAHYGRVYNRNFPHPPQLFKKDKPKIIDDKKVFSVILIMKYFIPNKDVWNDWLEKLKSLLDMYSEIDRTLIGFPPDWYTVLKK
ncbi:Abi family protein [Paenibacillus sp. KACC 21273]|uniref:Abi family protein n=1 Tax=Paenibacillus sp. KACC 21273 TaxID=3025665 RepID=UPI002366D12D|nr:Abi family protein [Paenibacillus sp. KACC 21273]WDF51015.1 Abi family protein [Paenibacillus sp. KACC 21273]